MIKGTVSEKLLEALNEMTKGKEIEVYLTDEGKKAVEKALNNKFIFDSFNHLLHCADILVEEREANRKEIQQLKDENETLKKVVDDQEKIISTYNGTYLQRAKVKNGKKIARKGTVTKEAIQQLKSQHLTINQISKKLGCSRSTIWRRLNE